MVDIHSKKLFDLYTHQEASITNRTNLMLVAQSFLVVGFIEAISHSGLQLVLATLGIIVTVFTVYIGGRELKFFFLVRDKLKRTEKIFDEIDAELKKFWYLKFLGRASNVLCFWMQILFGVFWIIGVIYSIWFIL